MLVNPLSSLSIRYMSVPKIMHKISTPNIKTNIFCPLAVNTKLRDVIMPGEDKSKISDPKDIAAKIVNYILEADGTGKIIEIT